jgi:diaminopimelate decarboxylase
MSRFNQLSVTFSHESTRLRKLSSVRLDNDGNIVPVLIADPEIGDYAVIGDTGAYSESMSPENDNSHRKPLAVMKACSPELVLIRKKQAREQLVENELDVKL